MSHSPSSYTTTYKSVPYFKLRKPTPKGAEAAAAAPAAGPWTVPALCAAYNWPSGLAGGGVIAAPETWMSRATS